MDQIFGAQNIKVFFYESIFGNKLAQEEFLDFLKINQNFFDESKKINQSLKNENLIHTKFSALIKKNKFITNNLKFISPKVKLFFGRKKYNISEGQENKYKKILENYYGYNYSDLKKIL